MIHFLQVYIASIGPNLISQRMRIAKILWDNNISAEYSHLPNPKFKKQLDDALERRVPYMVVFGDEEIEKKEVKIKAMKDHVEESVPIENMVDFLVKKGCSIVPAGADSDFLLALKSK